MDGAGLNPIGPIALNWASYLRCHALRLYTLGCSRTQSNTLHVLQRTALDLTPHKVGSG